MTIPLLGVLEHRGLYIDRLLSASYWLVSPDQDRIQAKVKMQLWMNVLILQLVLLLYIRETFSQTASSACDFNIDDPEGVDCSTIDMLLDGGQDRGQEGKLFEAIKYTESEGDLCKINGTKIGPYQISEKYYNEAVCFNDELALNG